MSNIKKIGIVGQGFVGSAVREGMKSSFLVETYDKYKGFPESTKNSLEDLVRDVEVSTFLPLLIHVLSNFLSLVNELRR